MGSAALYPTRCWFKGNLQGIGPCEGPLQRAHLIRAQVIAREVGSDFETLWNPKAWVPGCERHHRMLDHSRQIRIPRDRLPAAVEEVAAEWGLSWWVDREYPHAVIEGAWSTPATVSDDFDGARE